MEPRVSRRPCFVEEDTGLASLAVADMEAGFSGNNNNQINYNFCSRPVRRGSLRNLSVLASSSVASVSSSSPRSGYRFYDARYEEPQAHFLDACFNCKKALGNNRDIFMYRGDTPFCSEECRQEQIDIDEAKEKNWNLSSSMKALRKKEQNKSSSSTKTQDYRFRAGTVAAA